MNLNSTLVSFVIPCFNEEETLPSLIDEIMNTVKEMSEFEFEFILVNDGSTDSTLEIMKSIQRQLKKIIILDIPEQSGKIKAQAIGIENISSNSDISILIDADGQHNPKYFFLAKIGVLALSLLTKIAGVKYNSKISEFICVPNNALAKISKDARFGVIPIVMLIEDKISDCNYIEITIRPRYKNNEPSDKLSRHHPIDLYKKGFFHLFTNIYEILFRIFIFIGIIFSILAVYLFIIFIEAISNRNFNGVGSIILVQLISLFILTTIIVVMISMVLAFTLSFESLATKSRLTRDLKIYK